MLFRRDARLIRALAVPFTSAMRIRRARCRRRAAAKRVLVGP